MPVCLGRADRFCPCSPGGRESWRGTARRNWAPRTTTARPDYDGACEGNKPNHPEHGPRTATAALKHEPNPLQRLIHQRLHERGWSYGEVARRGRLPRSTVYTLATTQNLARPPRPATIKALAEGLDMPVSAVRAAAIEATGLYCYEHVPPGQEDQGDRATELLVARIDELTSEDRRHVAALLESLRTRPSRNRRTASTPPGRKPR